MRYGDRKEKTEDFSGLFLLEQQAWNAAPGKKGRLSESPRADIAGS
jgi:hypothetical protein